MNEDLETRLYQAKTVPSNDLGWFDKFILRLFGYGYRTGQNINENSVGIHSSNYRTEPKVDWKYVQGIDLRDKDEKYKKE